MLITPILLLVSQCATDLQVCIYFVLLLCICGLFHLIMLFISCVFPQLYILGMTIVIPKTIVLRQEPTYHH